MGFLLDDLVVYKKSLQHAQQIIEITRKPAEGFGDLVTQWRKSAVSIPGNIAEGCGRHTPADRSNFFVIARGSASECIPYVDLALNLKWIEATQAHHLRDLLEQIGKMLNGLIKAQG
jgi:four helix bundle protein